MQCRKSQFFFLRSQKSRTPHYRGNLTHSVTEGTHYCTVQEICTYNEVQQRKSPSPLQGLKVGAGKKCRHLILCRESTVDQILHDLPNLSLWKCILYSNECYTNLGMLDMLRRLWLRREGANYRVDVVKLWVEMLLTRDMRSGPWGVMQRVLCLSRIVLLRGYSGP